MRGRTWNSWTQFDTVDEPEHKKDRPATPSARPHPRENNSPASLPGPARCLHRTPAQAIASAMDLSEVRMERVARIKVAIAANAYQIPSSDLAQRLMQTMLGDFH